MQRGCDESGWADSYAEMDLAVVIAVILWTSSKLLQPLIDLSWRGDGEVSPCSAHVGPNVGQIGVQFQIMAHGCHVTRCLDNGVGARRRSVGEAVVSDCEQGGDIASKA